MILVRESVLKERKFFISIVLNRLTILTGLQILVSIQHPTFHDRNLTLSILIC
jgi:hypothetical protein